ncbi:MAG TPA: AMP-binding protein, partial [Methylotenera sp.]|nr:AMP-binding protein [Methylotenera sp.]
MALLADNSPEWLIIDLAAQQAGVVFLPLPIYFTTSQIQHALQSAAAQVLIYSPDDVSGEFLNNHVVEPQAFGNYSLQLVKGPFGPAINLPEGTDKITFTSGSIGAPKGVCLSNSQQLNVAKSLLTVTDLQSPRHLVVLPLSSLLENIAGVYAPLLAGGEVMLKPLAKKGYLAGHQYFLQSLIDSQPETMILVPELLTVLVNAVLSGWQPPSSLKFIAVGGSRVAADLIHKSRQLGLPVYEGYGLSEAGSVVSLNSRKADKPGSAGKVIPHLTVSIENGEVVIEDSEFLGYIGDQKPSEKKLFTGDIGQIDADGFLSIKGRKKQLIISSYGRNINPEWVESEVLA